MKEYIESLKVLKEKIDDSIYMAEQASKHLQEIIMSLKQHEESLEEEIKLEAERLISRDKAQS